MGVKCALRRICAYQSAHVLLAAIVFGYGLAHVGLDCFTQAVYAASYSSMPLLAGSTDINLIEANAGGRDFQVGQQLDSVLSISNQETAKPVTSAHPVTVIDMLPKGLASLSSSGVYWRITLSAANSPATLTAIYNGPYPLAAGMVLPPIIVSGIFTKAAIPIVTSNVLLEMSDQSNVLYTVSTYKVHTAAIVPSHTHLAAAQSTIMRPPYPRNYLTPLPDNTFYPDLPHTGY